ncbi:MAG: ion channel [Candidatus Endonucleobacter bathymodioli]|uniref:Ion channel n=1 Tax=Candidatus Endonucleibacter bathymodioli TaxID=539814 RepID=A0AA90P099_9GAMM|nr:ion channel [Candidatus Endonucleobacter bathymodioli]
MKLIRPIYKFCNSHMLKISWLVLTVILVLHFSFSWLVLVGAGEQVFVQPIDWIYFYVTTATTIGYGDFSPETNVGKLFSAVIVMPGAVLLFAAFLGKLSSLFIRVWRKGMQGKTDYSRLKDHIVILGWHPEKTSRMVQLIFGDVRGQKRVVVLCTAQNLENPFPNLVRFVRGARLLDKEVFRRAALEQAGRIIIFQKTDDQTLAACLSVCATKTTAHVVAWFEDSRMAGLVQSHCPQVECHTNLSVDLLVRSAQDPGSSRLQSQLLSTLEGPTLFSVQVPDDFKGTTFACLLGVMKGKHEAIAMGLAETVMGKDLLLNPPGDHRVRAGNIIYFIAAARVMVSEVAWSDMVVG